MCFNAIKGGCIMEHKKLGGKFGILPIVLFTVIVVAVVISVIAVYKIGMREKTIDDSLIYMQSATVCTASSAHNFFDGNLDSLEYCAAAFSNVEDMSVDEIHSMLVEFSELDTFKTIAYVSAANDVTTYNKAELMPVTRMLAQEAMAKGRMMKSASESRVDVDLYSVPVVNTEGTVIGALVAGTEPAVLTDRYCPTASVSGSFYVSDIDGDIIHSRTEENGPFVSGDNILLLLEQAGNDINTIKADLLRNGASGGIRVTLSGEEYLINYSSIDAFNWTVLSVVPVTAVIGKADNTTSYAVYLVSGVIIVLVGLMIYVIHYTIQLRKQAYAAIEDSRKLYYEDNVTGFSTWQAFIDSYENRMKDTSTNYALVSIDINKFKAVNDALGFDGGNAILRHTAEIISRSLGKNDLFARNSGDLFYVLMENKSDDDLIEKIRHIINDIDYQITEVKIFISVGIYRITDRSMKIRAMADRADIARKNIKIKNESAYMFFDTSMIENIRNEKSIEDIMEDALAKHEFKVFLQPKVDLDGKNDIIGAEALVRWFHDGEIIPPGRFIPIFEKNGFVTQLDFYMFKEVCKLQKSWLSQGYEPKIVSVNMSRLHLRNDDFVQTLSNYCKEYEIDPKYFEIEITESAAYENIDILMEIFRQIKAAGFHVSIDDFGTGYSSLNMLKDLPVDVLKIDRSFLTENADETENASKIIGCVVSLASSLNISTICEGIETKEQANLLEKLGCNMAQGFYFARPMPVEEYEKVVYHIERKD